MTEPTVSVTLGTATAMSVRQTSSAAAGYVAVQSSSPGPIVQPAETSASRSLQDTDPELRWLASAQARRYRGHWVALDPDSGEFLGLADTREQLRVWRERDVSLLFVEPHRRAG